MKLRKILKIIIPLCTFLFGLFVAYTTGVNVYAAEIEEDLKIYDIEDYEIPEEYKELYSMEKYNWYKVQAKYWLVYHNDHDIDLGDKLVNSYQMKCETSGYNQNHTYAFCRFEKEDGTLIDNITFLEYSYTNENGKDDNYWQEVNVLPNNNTEYEYDGTFLSMNNILGFDNGNGEIKNGALIPGLSSTLEVFGNPGHKYTYDYVVRPCKVAYSQDELKKIRFDTYFEDGVIQESLEYEECNYLMYWPTQCIEELEYINIWWVEEKDGTLVDNKGTFTSDGSSVGVDSNGNLGIYSLNKELLTGYTIREDGIIIDANGNPTISWDEQCKGAVVIVVDPEPSDWSKWWDDLFGQKEDNWWDKLLGSLKRAGIFASGVLISVGLIWLITRIIKWIKDIRG